MSERGNPEPYRTFRAHGAYAEKKSDLFSALRGLQRLKGQDDSGKVEAGGHPDYIVLHPPFGYFVEVKSTSSTQPNNFPFAEISNKQREWLSAWDSISWIWLFMGDRRPQSQHILRRRAFLVPWRHWLAVEEQMKLVDLVSISIVPHQVSLRETHTADIWLGSYALSWKGDRTWEIPDYHPYWKAYDTTRMATKSRS